MVAVLIVAVISCSIASLFIVPAYFKSRDREQQQATIRAAIERGQPLPPELIDAMTRSVKPRPTASSDFRTALIWLAVAAGIAGFGYAISFDANEALYPLIACASIPGFVGAAFLLMGVLNLRKDKAT